MGLEIRDPIHGFIHREPHERDIIDTPLFQRLRKIKQLALATLVYPGAVHTRFDHSIGAFHVAGRMAAKLLTSSSEQRLVRLAALLHDIGHGPFSHVSEEVLEQFASRERLSLKEGQQIHELLTTQVIATDCELRRLISDVEREQIANLLNGTYGDSILKSIISGPVDADKQDYLLRDSHFCGVKYGVYDPERLADTLRVHEDGEDRFLALSVDGIHALEQFVLAKYYMTTQVYRHRVRLITDQMIVRGITLGIEHDKLGCLRDLYTYDGSIEYIQNYLQWQDERLVTTLLDKTTPEGYAKLIFHKLVHRNLLKRIFSGQPADFREAEVRKQIFEGERGFFNALQREVAKQYGWDENLVITQLVRLRSVRAQAVTTEGQIIVLRPDGPKLFHEESTLFKSIDAAAEEQYLEVYAPVRYADDREKRKKRRQFHIEIVGMAAELAKRWPSPSEGEERR